MTLLAVAPDKFAAGLEPDGFAYRKVDGEKQQLSYVPVEHVVAAAENVLNDVYATDAHFVCYVVRRSGAPVRLQPRINKPGLDTFESSGCVVTLETLVADVDNPEHAAWDSPAAARAEADRVSALLRTCGVYATRSGLRIVQPLARSLPVDQAELALRVWLAQLEAAGLSPDWRCTDWTRHFRAPHVKRDRVDYRSPAVVLARMAPVPAPAGGAVLRARGGKRSPRLARVDVASVLSPAWAPLVEPLARALAVGGYKGERHAIGLALAGALLSRRIPAEQVPALTVEIARAAGWDGEHHRTGAIDTVRRWAEDHGVAGLAALPASVRDVLETATDTRRAQLQAVAAKAPRSSSELGETTRRLYATIESAPEGLTVIKAQCGLGKTHQARSVAVVRASRSGEKKNERTAIAVPTTELAAQVTRDLENAGTKVLRMFGPLSVRGPKECRFWKCATILEEGRQSVQHLYCKKDCEHEPTCEVTAGQEGDTDADVIVGPHALLADLDQKAHANGLLFIDEPPPIIEDEVFQLDDLLHAEAELKTDHFERRYAAAMACALNAVREWVTYSEPEQAGPIARALVAQYVNADLERDSEETTGLATAIEQVRGALLERQIAPPIARQTAQIARSAVTLAQRLSSASKVLFAVHRAFTNDRFRATVYDRKGRTLVITGPNRELENAILCANPDGTAKSRRVIVAAADAHLYLDAYSAVLGYVPAFREFSAPDGAPIARSMIVVKATRSKWCTDDAGPIENAARWVASWALEAPALASCGVVTFQRHERAVLRALEAAAPSVRWAVGHYGAMRGLDRWKDFDGVATLGDPRPNMDHVSRELGGAGAEVEGRIERADDRARAELEQAHGRLRTVHRTRPGRALHVGALLPGAWSEPVDFRRPPEGRPRRDAVSDIARLVEAAGGQRAAARVVARSLSTVQRWISGEGTPSPADLDVLRRAGTERRPAEQGDGDPVRATYINLYVGDTGSPQESDEIKEAAE